MKKISTLKIIFISWVTLASQLLLASPPNKLPETKKELKDVFARTATINTGENGLLFFFTSEHCPYDQEWKSRILSLSKLAKQQKINVFTINPHSESAYEHNNHTNMKKTSKYFSKDNTYLMDPPKKWLKKFRVKRTPSVYLFNNQKKLAYYGAIDNQPEAGKKITSNYLLKAIQSLKENKSPKIKQTHVLGCKISFVK